jgi:ethanolamine ammonia-lyase small subunit
MAEPPPLPDLRRWTQARVGLGRVGQALPTTALLDFQLAHARARDAVLAELDAASLVAALDGREVIEVGSRAGDQPTYLQRPDFGRLLDEADEARLQPGRHDAALVIADGLSATAVHRHAVPLLHAIVKRLPGWTLAPIVIARHARVALGDEIGGALGADLTLILIGERPGLSAPDSLGAYLTWAPRRGRLDSERNCVSNIRPPHGLSHDMAADRIVGLMIQARLRRLTGVGLKMDEALPPPL